MPNNIDPDATLTRLRGLANEFMNGPVPLPDGVFELASLFGDLDIWLGAKGGELPRDWTGATPAGDMNAAIDNKLQNALDAWIKSGGLTELARISEPAPVDAAVERAKREILKRVQAGDFNGHQITRFADLHDHLDANTLGGLADNDFPLTGDALIDFGNELQSKLDAWILAGGLTNDLDASNDRWLTVGELCRYLANFPEDTPVTATNAAGGDWLNVVGANNPYESGEPSLVLTTRDDFNLGQF